MATIKEDTYNKAKAMLTQAGSKTAAKSHPKHGKDGGVEMDHGKELLREARDEFTALKDVAKQKAGRDTVVKAAKVMGISSW